MSPVDSIHTPEGQIISLFPSGTSLNENKELLIGGCLASELVSTFGTPALIIDEAALRDRARRFKMDCAVDGLILKLFGRPNHFHSPLYFASLVKKALELMLLVVVNSLWL